ncbi:hypothetical protein Bca52824_046222 [Brassica carinata]|uniref:Uncharacterized protein n=1 Tax=Brassica carinata TaxID=52824 RepID=A0A8X7REY3_BRACI|nr:hypothetical protein Bca52824_046222 [Brassica carinata]
MSLEPDPRWPYLKKWLVTASPSPQLPRSVPPLLKSKTLEPEEDVPQPLMNSSCSPESGEEIITSSKEMVSLIHNHSQMTVQDPKNAREGMIDPQQMLQPDSSLSPATSSPSPSLGAWTIPLKMASFNSMGTDKKRQGAISIKLLGRLPYEPSPFIKAASQEYPWAAKMKSVCNLNRVTFPEYLEDGTPKVTVSSHVLLQGIQNQKEYVVGQFYCCSAPAGGLIHAVDSSHANVQCEEELHDTSAVSSEKMSLEPDPRWPYLKKWLVTASPSPQLPRSVPPLLKSKTLEPEEDVPQPLMNSSCSPESGEEIITSSKEMVSLIHNHSQMTVQDPKNAREGMIDPQQMLQPDSSLSPATSSPSPSLGAWTIPLKMASFNSMGTDKKARPSQSSFGRLGGLVCLRGDRKLPTPSGTFVSVRQYEPSPFIKAASQEYPWAAKMKSVCNLNRLLS